MKNACPFYIEFFHQILKVLLIKIYKIKPPCTGSFISYLLIVLHWFQHQLTSFFTTFQKFIQHYLKKDFCHKLYFFNEFPRTPGPTPRPTKSAEHVKSFLMMLPINSLHQHHYIFSRFFWVVSINHIVMSSPVIISGLLTQTNQYYSYR